MYKRKEGSWVGEKVFKAKPVAKEFTQRKGVDYDEFFALVAKYSTLRLLLSLVCIFGLVLDQMDIITTLFALQVLFEEDLHTLLTHVAKAPMPQLSHLLLRCGYMGFSTNSATL
ncbi:hypothetical protein R1flu_006754 [Riccia fluitans]|uniref:Reverse transcriptase Ty1/copia-type domain-containing protein n=1 Tax=Riccia fluitans TaxID=41844 RepID=A0ABD1YXR5_9MARC